MQCTGTIIPMRNIPSTFPECFHRITEMEKDAMAPVKILSTRVTVHTIAEFSVALPRPPATQADA